MVLLIGLTDNIPKQILEEKGMPSVGVCFWREDRREPTKTAKSVKEFLEDPANQKGFWLMDGGWGGPPGPVVLKYHRFMGVWTFHGYWAGLNSEGIRVLRQDT